MEDKHKLEPQAEFSTNIRTNINKAAYNWKYKLVEGINPVHYRDRIYVPKTLHKCVLKWYHSYLQHPCGDRLDHALNTIYRWFYIVYQERKLCITCKDCQKLKKRNAKYGLLPANDSETLNPWYTVCVDLIDTYTIISKVIHTNKQILTKDLQLLCMIFI